ncbi:MAG: class III extradiol ring-cleavage dioxygenase [Thermoanaerobaculia bacterium]|jgi:4,5-DOPA dioxygenase extradiol
MSTRTTRTSDDARPSIPPTDWSRRDLLGAAIGAGAILSAGSASAAAGGAASEARDGVAIRSKDAGRLPTLFVAHGAPPLLDDAGWVRELGNWAAYLARPRAIVMLSAHWEARPVTIGATRTVPLIYDFFGFPQHYYEQRYAAPGAPELAARVRGLLSGAHPTTEAPHRGLDHGAYVPLVAMYPEADVPVLQVSLPSEDPKELFALGEALAPLRDEGVLLTGSGFITHNLRTVDWHGGSPPPSWAVEFDQWTAEALARRDVDALLDYEKKGPGVRMALPTREHFVPLLVALGASGAKDALSFPIDGFWLGSLTRRSVQFGS